MATWEGKVARCALDKTIGVWDVGAVASTVPQTTTLDPTGLNDAMQSGAG